MKKLMLAILIVIPLLLMAVHAEPPREGYVLTYSDEFDGEKLNLSDWHYRNEGYKTRGGYNSPSQVSVKDGNLVIKFSEKNGEYYGGGVITNFGLGYGYYEVRSKLFGETGGLHSSFWTAGVGGDGTDRPLFNQSIELDFYEVDSNRPGHIPPNFHYWLGGHLGENKNVIKTEDGGNLFDHITDASKDYFISGCEYLPDRCVWYINGVKVCEVYDYEMYGTPSVWLTALANTELSGDIDEDKLPGASYWDYFRYYAMPLKGENLFVNPSFDDNNRADYFTEAEKRRLDDPVSWLEIGDIHASKIVLGDEYARTGTGALELGKMGEYKTEVSQKLWYIAKGDYTATFYVKNEQGAEVEVFIGDNTLKIGKTEGYEKFTLDGTVDGDFAYAGIRAKGKTQFVYADDFSICAKEGYEEFNRKVPIDSYETTEIPGEVMADNEDADTCKFEGEWLKSSLQGFKMTSVYNNAKSAKATWSMKVKNDGIYKAQLYKIIYSSSCTNVKCTLFVNGKEIKTDYINLQEGKSGWHDFGSYELKKDDVVEVTMENAGSGYLRADCTRLVPGDASVSLQTGILLKIGQPVAYKSYAKRFIDPDNREITPFINENNRTLVPLRFIAESLNAKVSYEQKAGILGGYDEIKIKLGESEILFSTGVEKYAVNGKISDMDTAPENKMERTFVPLRVLAEAFGKHVSYDTEGLIGITETEIKNAEEMRTVAGFLY